MELIVLALVGLTVLVASALFSRRTGIAAPLLLLVLGIAASFIPWVPDVELSNEVVLLGILPPILFASGRNVPAIELRRNLKPIAWLSIVMVIVPAVVVGLIVNALFSEISLPLAIALGAAVSPIDAVAATSIGRRLGLPDRIMTLLEGESLFNDAAALVTMRMAVAALAAGFSLVEASLGFLWAVVGGLAIGYVVGRIINWARGRLDDPILVTVATIASPWASYIPAEQVHASGVIAVVVSSVVMTHLAPRSLNAEERTMVRSTWATVSYVLEHAVFLLMGMQITLLVSDSRSSGGMGRVWLMALVVLVVLIVLRAIGVAVVVWMSNHREARARTLGRYLKDGLPEKGEERARARFGENWELESSRWLNRTRADIDYALTEQISPKGGVVLAWAGMRGVVTLAAIQTLPYVAGGQLVEHRGTVILVAFLVAVASLLLFGGTLPFVIRSTGLAAPGVDERRNEEKMLVRSMLETVNRELGPLAEQTIDSEPVPPHVITKLERRMAVLNNRTNTEALRLERDTRDIYWALFTRYLDALRLALEEERSVGAYSHHALRSAEDMLDRLEVNARSRG